MQVLIFGTVALLSVTSPVLTAPHPWSDTAIPVADGTGNGNGNGNVGNNNGNGNTGSGNGNGNVGNGFGNGMSGGALGNGPVGTEPPGLGGIVAPEGGPGTDRIGSGRFGPTANGEGVRSRHPFRGDFGRLWDRLFHP